MSMGLVITSAGSWAIILGAASPASYSTGRVGGNRLVGGLVAHNHGSLAASYSTAAVHGDENVGGLVGENSRRDSTIASSYSTGTVSGRSSVGGLVGLNFEGNLTHCFSTGPVSGQSNVGGLVGLDVGRPQYKWSATGCFWDTQTSGQATSAGGTGKITAEMQTASTFLIWGTCGRWAVWTIDEGRDYPRLWWQNRPGEPIALHPACTTS